MYLKPLKRFYKKIFSFLSLFLICALLSVMLLYFNKQVLYINSGIEHSKAKYKFDVIKKVSHDKKRTFITIYSDTLKSYTITDDEIEAMDDENKKVFFRNLLNGCKSMNIEMFVDIQKSLLFVKDKNKEETKIFPIKTISLSKLKKLRLSEFFREYVHWSSKSIKNDFSDFLNDISIYIMTEETVLLKAMSNEMIMLHTAVTTKTYRGDFISWLFNISKHETINFFDLKTIVNGMIKNNKMHLIIENVKFDIEFPCEFKSEMKKTKNKFSKKEKDRLYRIDLKSMHNSKNLNCFLEYMNAFRTSTFVENLKKVDFTKFSYYKVTFTVTQNTKWPFATSKNVLFKYKIPNNNVSVFT
ncbi:hypothetical protein EHP00_20 [Ecytonucleospora hepatopenaei]|uniref:Uncharacterized protein n=1 Tax=Ecytonucleospora hepatopenaei TaxID=646526 RepID=A0A1W0E5P4_9MICR|nr:hypothetical protein EHP00_20 [Ecytonucleospora hepatopenaei]